MSPGLWHLQGRQSEALIGDGPGRGEACALRWVHCVPGGGSFANRPGGQMDHASGAD